MKGKFVNQVSIKEKIYFLKRNMEKIGTVRPFPMMYKRR